MPRFSVIITTRERVKMLNDCMNSIRDTVSDFANVEIIVMSDNDDADTTTTMLNPRSHFPKVRWYSRQRSRWMHKDYINVGAKIAEGKYVVSVNDDVVFRTKDWDRLVWDRLEEYLKDKPDGVVYGQINDGMTNRPPHETEFCCFPLISKKAIDAMGHMFNDRYMAWSADIAIYHVYKNVNRVVNLKDIFYIEHLSDLEGKRPKDAIDVNTEQISNNEHTIDPGATIGDDTAKISRYLNDPKWRQDAKV